MNELINLAEKEVSKARQILYLLQSINIPLTKQDKKIIIQCIKNSNIYMLRIWYNGKKTLLTMSVKELRVIASRNNIYEYSWLRKEELIDAINREQESYLDTRVS